MSRKVRVRQSKGQSMVGFFAGLLFCGIGIFVVIPIFGLFGLLWTFFAVIITVMQAINAFSDKGIATHEIVIDEDSGKKQSNDTKTLEQRMTELQALYNKGLITLDEYESKRRDIIDEI